MKMQSTCMYHWRRVMKMFKNGVISFILLIMLCGCQYMGPVTKYKKNLESQNIIESLKNENYFDEDKWNIDYVCFSGLPCINGGFWTMISYDQGNKVFNLQEDNIIIEQFKQDDIIEKYSIDYLFNNYLFSANTNYIGARLWWLLESNNIGYSVNLISSKVIFDDVGGEKINGIYCENTPTTEEMEHWLKDNKNLEQIDYSLLFENSNCTLKIYVHTDAKKELNNQLNEQAEERLGNKRIELNLD